MYLEIRLNVCTVLSNKGSLELQVHSRCLGWEGLVDCSVLWQVVTSIVGQLFLCVCGVLGFVGGR